MKIIPVKPNGKCSAPMFVDWRDVSGGRQGAFCDVPVETYPPSPCGEALRLIRVLAGFGLREGAALLGITASELSSLERGSAVLADSEWIAAFRALRAACKR